MCSRYNNKAVDFILPTQIIFSTLCESYDKTNIFLVGILRTIIFIIIYMYVFSSNELEESYTKIPRIIFMGYIMINMLILLYIISKKQKYSKYDNSNQNVLSDTHDLNT